MKNSNLMFTVIVLAMFSLCCVSCNSSSNGDSGTLPEGEAEIIFLHHSTGQNIWDGGVFDWFTQNAPQYQIVDLVFPKDEPYGWKNYPYDYWNIWVNHAGSRPYQEEPTLEMLTARYQMIIFKHCFPVSAIEENVNAPDVASEDKRLENYYLQYNALRDKLREFPNTRFLVWTGAALVRNATDAEMADRARTFFTWVKNIWDQPGDNIYIWDFYELETEGGLYMRDEYAEGPDDSHPNAAFAQRVAPLFARRIVDVLEGRGD